MKFLLAVFFCLGLAPQAVSFSPPAWSLNQPLYEVNLEMFSKKGNFKALEARLPELKGLGIGILWLMPIYPRGDWSAYCVTSYDSIHPPFGTAEDLKSLVSHAHALGLHVILDWVGNHTSWQHSWVKEHPDYYVHDKQGKIQQAHEWTDVAQLDYSKARLRKAMIQAMAYWVREFGIDGFRCDVAWGVPVDFWIQARAELEKIRPLYMLAESDNPAYQAAFDSDYDWGLMNSGKINLMTDIAKGLQSAAAVTRLIRREQPRFKAPFSRLHFTTNHDEWQDNGTVFERLGGAAKAMAVLACTLPGKPLLYNGQEIGWKQRKGSIDWSDGGQARSYREFYRGLLQAWQSKPALYAGNWNEIPSSVPASICAYTRQSGTARTRVILNLSDRTVDFSLYDPVFSKPLQFKFGPWQTQISSSEQAPLTGAAEADADRPGAASGCDWSGWTPIRKLALGQPGGVNASFQTRYDSKIFYVNVSVSKTALVHDSPDNTPWDDDAVELFFDMKRCRATPYQADDFQFIVGYKNPVLFESQGRIQGVKYACQGAPGGYTASLAIPWKTLQFKPAQGVSFGFDAGVDIDIDGASRDAALIWSGDDQNYHDTWAFGDLTLTASCP